MKAAIVLMMTNNKEQELHEMLRSAEIPDEIREEWAVKTITRAIERGRKKAVPLAWLEWAFEDYTEEESISVKLFNAAETELEKAVARIAGERESEYCLDFVKDVLSGGCVNGTVGELIYTGDCVAFYQKHKKDIQKLVTEMMSDCGIDSMKGLFGDKFDAEDPFCEGDENQNLLAWFGFEEALRTLANRIELDI